MREDEPPEVPCFGLFVLALALIVLALLTGTVIAVGIAVEWLGW